MSECIDVAVFAHTIVFWDSVANERKSDNRNFLLPQFKNQTLVDRENRENSANC